VQKMISKICKNPIFVFFTALFCCALWGVSVPVIKTGYKTVNSSHVPTLLLWAGLQFAFAGILTVCLYSIKSKRFLLPQKQSLWGIVKIGVFQIVLQYACSYIGLANTTSVKGAILKGSDVFFCMIVSSLMFKYEKLTVRKIFACIIGFTGLVIVNLNGLQLDFNPLGDGLVVISTFFYAVAVGFSKSYCKLESPIMLSGYSMAFGGALMCIIGLALNGKINFLSELPLILCLACIFTLSYALWGMLVKYNDISKISLFGFTVPIFGVIFSSILINEKNTIPTANLIIALILICTGIIICNANHRRRRDLCTD